MLIGENPTLIHHIEIENLTPKKSSIRFSSILVLAIITFSLLSAQPTQVTTQPAPSSHLIPPPPSAPSWTYTMIGHVRAVAVSANGKAIVAAAESDGPVHLFGRDSNTPILNYSVGNRGAINLAISADGNTTVVGQNSGDFYAFCNKSTAPLWHYYDSGLGASQSVAVSSDGSTIVIGTNDGYLYVFSRTSGTPLWSYHWGVQVDAVATSKNGSTIVAAFVNSTGIIGYLCEFGRTNNSTLWTIKNRAGEIYDAAISEDGNTTAAVTDSRLGVLSRASNKTLWTSNTASGYGVAVSGDGSTIASGGYNTLYVFGRTSNTTLITGNVNGVLHHTISLSYGGSLIACGTQNYSTTSTHDAFLYSRSSGQMWNYTVGAGIGPYYWLGRAVGMSADGSVIAYGSDDHKLYVFIYDIVPPVLGVPTYQEIAPSGSPNANLSISLTVSDNIAVSSVKLYYRLAGSGTWNTKAMSQTSATYSSTIGPFSFGSNVTYYVNATDTSGNFVCSPSNAPTSYYNITVAPHSIPPTAPIPIALIAGGIAAAVIVAVAALVMKSKKSAGRGKTGKK